MTTDPVFRGGGVVAPLVLKISAQARVMRLRVDTRTAQVLLTVPRRVPRKRALDWAETKRAWIEAALARIEPAQPIVPGASIPYRGLTHRIDWQEGRSRAIRLDDGMIHVGGPLDSLEARIARWLRAEALKTLSAETAHYAALAGVSVTRVGVGDQRSRWGSCSSSGAIRYSWRLILAPDHVRRATVAHEVAHRVHMNHGPDFHALVEQLFGADPQPANDWLRRHGAALHRIGRQDGAA